MLSVLVNAYACGPNLGSEPGVGWNWIIYLAQHCHVYVITEGEWREEIEKALLLLPQKDRIHFFYLPVNDEIRKMCWNQGDWRFYYYYRKWQLNALKLARTIMKSYAIDVVHQLNMIGFREPGYLYRIKEIPFVWGPIGGTNLFPEAYLTNASLKKTLTVKLKNILNKCQMRYHVRVKKAILRADALISAIPETQKIIKSIYGKDSFLISETGCDIVTKDKSGMDRFYDKQSFNVLWVGRFFFAKQLEIALKAIAEIKQLPGLKFHIIGDGTNEERNYYKELATTLGIDELCVWHGQISNSEVHRLMQESQLFFFSSVSEATSTVILEALGNCLPILCFNTCGFGAVVNDMVGNKVELSEPNQSVHDFAERINYLYGHRELLAKQSENCCAKINEISWDEKIMQVLSIYNQVIEKYDKHS